MSNTLNVNSDTIQETNSSEFNRKNIEALTSHVRLVDSDAENGLDLFCYINCKKSDTDLVQQCRGVVFHGDNVVLKSFPYTMEYTDSDNEEIQQNINLEESVVYDSYEGTIIKVFYHGSKWYICTNRKLDAYKSNWASKESFGMLFNKALIHEFNVNERLRNIITINETDDAINVFCDNVLDKSKQYMFLLLNSSENRIVCDAPENPTVFHVGTFKNGILSMEDDICIPYPNKIDVSNYYDIYDYVNNIDYTKKQGVIIFTQNRQYKIVNKDYKSLYEARGNEPSINFSYLKIRMDSNKRDMLRYLYPNSLKNFEEYENILYDTSKRIYDAYVRRYIKREFMTLPPEEYKIMSQAHEWYLQNKTTNKITYNKIIDIMNSQEPTKLNRIIRNIKLDAKIEQLGGEKRQRFNPRLLPRPKNPHEISSKKSDELKENTVDDEDTMMSEDAVDAVKEDVIDEDVVDRMDEVKEDTVKVDIMDEDDL